MAEWTRTTPWRQGQLLPEEAITAFKLVNSSDEKKTVAVIISHDCDLAADLNKEPNAEIIVGSRLEKPNGNFENAKNARVLHISYFGENKQEWMELVATEKR